MELQKANITLYTLIKDHHIIFNAMKKHFEDISIHMEEAQDSLIVTLFDETKVQLHQMINEIDVKQQVAGMRNYFAQAPCERKEVLEQVLLQISMFTCISGIEFTLDEQEDRTHAIIGRIYAIAQDSASILLYPDMSLYTPKGELLLSIDGTSEVDAFRPIGYQDILRKEPTFEKEDHDRFERVTKELKDKGYPTISHIMSTQMTKQSLHIPSKEDIVKRAIAVFACAVCAEGTLMEGGSRDIGLREFQAIDDIFGCHDYLSEQETSYVKMEEIEETISVQFSWRYECCAVLLWALGLYELNDYDELCDVSSMAQTIRSFPSLEEMCKLAKLKSEEELLDMHTRVLYYHWSCVEARIHHIELDGIDDGVVQEHHYAMNWLTGANDTENWDEIQCNT